MHDYPQPAKKPALDIPSSIQDPTPLPADPDLELPLSSSPLAIIKSESNSSVLGANEVDEYASPWRKKEIEAGVKSNAERGDSVSHAADSAERTKPEAAT